jgi:hypothetical protein
MPPLMLMPPMDELELRRSIASIVVATPSFSSCSRVITVTGSEVSPSMRLMLEPVISMRSSRCACCAPAPAASVSARPAPSARSTAAGSFLCLQVMDFPVVI